MESKKYEKSCGVIVLKKEDSRFFVLLVHHNLGHWGIPKGHMEKGEKEEETAIREVLEETGITTSIIDGFRRIISYSPKKATIKDVVFFLGEAKTFTIHSQESEVEEARFIEIEESLKVVTYLQEKEVIKEAIKFLS